MASTTSHQPVIVQVPTDYPQSQRNGNCSDKLFVVFGCMQISMGGASVVLNAVAIVMDIYLSESGYGIWSAALWIVAGSFGIAAGKLKTSCLIKTTMVLSIVSACSIVYYLPMTAVALEVTEGDWDYSSDFNAAHALAVISLMMICVITECVFAILTSCLCCRAICCRKPNVGVQQQPAQFAVPMQQPASVPIHASAQPGPVQGVNSSQVQGFQINLPAGYQIVYTGNVGFVGGTSEQQAGPPAPPAYTVDPKY